MLYLVYIFYLYVIISNNLELPRNAQSSLELNLGKIYLN